jgi:hypothetical protein
MYDKFFISVPIVFVTHFLHKPCKDIIALSSTHDVPQVRVAQPFYTRGTLNDVEESWQHTNTILRIVGGGGELVYGIDWPRQLLKKRPQPKNVLFDVHNYPSLENVICFKYIHYLK